ncbi:MAG: hypothetical protein ACFFFG_18210 [Candidatus Thorarchaeota archaeon]
MGGVFGAKFRIYDRALSPTEAKALYDSYDGGWYQTREDPAIDWSIAYNHDVIDYFDGTDNLLTPETPYSANWWDNGDNTAGITHSVALPSTTDWRIDVDFVYDADNFNSGSGISHSGLMQIYFLNANKDPVIKFTYMDSDSSYSGGTFPYGRSMAFSAYWYDILGTENLLLYDTPISGASSVDGVLSLQYIDGFGSYRFPDDPSYPFPNADTWQSIPSNGFERGPITYVMFHYETDVYSPVEMGVRSVTVESEGTPAETQIPWTDPETVTANVDGLDTGTYPYTISAYNTGGYYNDDTVTVQVSNPIPLLTGRDSPVEPLYSEAGASNILSMTFFDTDADYYKIFDEVSQTWIVDGTSNGWTGGSPIDFDLAVLTDPTLAQPYTEYNLIWYAYDSAGQYNDHLEDHPTRDASIQVRITDNPPTINTPDPIRMSSGAVGVYIEWQDADDGNPSQYRIGHCLGSSCSYPGTYTFTDSWSTDWTTWAGGAVSMSLDGLLGENYFVAELKDQSGQISQSGVTRVDVIDWDITINTDFTVQYTDSLAALPASIEVGYIPEGYGQVVVDVWVEEAPINGEPDCGQSPYELCWQDIAYNYYDTGTKKAYYDIPTTVWSTIAGKGLSSVGTWTLRARAYHPDPGYQYIYDGGNRDFNIIKENLVITFDGSFPYTMKRNQAELFLDGFDATIRDDDGQTVDAGLNFNMKARATQSGDEILPHAYLWTNLKNALYEDITGVSSTTRIISGNDWQMRQFYFGTESNYYVSWSGSGFSNYNDYNPGGNNYITITAPLSPTTVPFDNLNGFTAWTSRPEVGIGISSQISWPEEGGNSLKCWGTLFDAGWCYATWDNTPIINYKLGNPPERGFYLGYYDEEISVDIDKGEDIFFSIYWAPQTVWTEERMEIHTGSNTYVRIRASDVEVYSLGSQRFHYDLQDSQEMKWWGVELRLTSNIRRYHPNFSPTMGWAYADIAIVKNGVLEWRSDMFGDLVDPINMGHWNLFDNPTAQGIVELSAQVGTLTYTDAYFDTLTVSGTPAFNVWSSSPPVQTDGVVSNTLKNVVERNDSILWTDTFNFNGLQDIVEQGSILISLNGTQEQAFGTNSLNYQIENDTWQILNIGKISGNIPEGSVRVNTSYDLLINGSWTNKVLTHPLYINDSASSFISSYDLIQIIPTSLQNTDFNAYSTEERLTLLSHIRYLADLVNHQRYSDIQDYIGTNTNMTEKIRSYLIGGSDNPRLAIILANGDNMFNTIHKMGAINNEYLDQIRFFKERNYHAYWLTNEFLTQDNLALLLNRIESYETPDLNYSLVITYIGHTIDVDGKGYANETQGIVLNSGRILTDSQIANLFSPLESNQFFIINSCFSEGILHELERADRILLGSSKDDLPVRVGTFSPYSPFYDKLHTLWDDQLSIEENIAILFQQFAPKTLVFVDGNPMVDWYLTKNGFTF